MRKALRDQYSVLFFFYFSILAGDSTRSILLETFPTPHPGPEPILSAQQDPPPAVPGRDINTVA